MPAARLGRWRAALRVEDADGENFLGQIDADGSTLVHDAPSCEGQDVKSVAAAYGVNVRSVFRWLADFASGGQNALLSKPIPGRPPKVSPEQMRWLARAVQDRTPQQFKFAFGLWTLSLIGALIEREFGTKLSLASVSRIALPPEIRSTSF